MPISSRICASSTASTRGGPTVEREAHLLNLARPVALNPVCVGPVEAPCAGSWTSDDATVGEEDSVPAFLKTDWLLRAFAERRAEAVAGNYGDTLPFTPIPVVLSPCCWKRVDHACQDEAFGQAASQVRRARARPSRVVRWSDPE
jgi:hypothetical protein